jgi:hypothetical protein
MGHASFGQGFSVLAAGILEATAGTPQINTPKKVGFAAPALGGKLSRQPGNVINDETRVEEHNKKVTTTSGLNRLDSKRRKSNHRARMRWKQGLES